MFHFALSYVLWLVIQKKILGKAEKNCIYFFFNKRLGIRARTVIDDSELRRTAYFPLHVSNFLWDCGPLTALNARSTLSIILVLLAVSTIRNFQPLGDRSMLPYSQQMIM